MSHGALFDQLKIPFEGCNSVQLKRCHPVEFECCDVSMSVQRRATSSCNWTTVPGGYVKQHSRCGRSVDTCSAQQTLGPWDHVGPGWSEWYELLKGISTENPRSAENPPNLVPRSSRVCEFFQTTFHFRFKVCNMKVWSDQLSEQLQSPLPVFCCCLQLGLLSPHLVDIGRPWRILPGLFFNGFDPVGFLLLQGPRYQLGQLKLQTVENIL